MSVYVLKGLSPWVIQRISAVFVALFIVYAFVCAYCANTISYELWLAWLFAPLNTILVALTSTSSHFTVVGQIRKPLRAGACCCEETRYSGIGELPKR